jgi:uncharacterized protein DUF3142
MSWNFKAILCLIFTLHLIGGVAKAALPVVPLPHEAYIWQRSWNTSVINSLTNHGHEFSTLVVLGAEISFQSGRQSLIRVPVDYSALKQTHASVGIAMRIGRFSGSYLPDDSTARFLAQTAAGLAAEARARGLNLRELQIDFDCAESKLQGYRVWLDTFRKKLAPLPLTITVLPAWLNQPSFKDLVHATDGFVLQVHSLERPRLITDRFTLCDPAAAMKAVDRAASFQVSFRVALPTYGYQVAYDAKGAFIGLAAEGTAQSWPESTQLREVRSDPAQIASLVQAWATNHPTALRGIIWYRFPVSDDILNWRWPTLSAIVALRFPKESVQVQSRRIEPGLIEISLVNNGELDISSRLAVEVRWLRDGGARLLAADGLRGFELVDGEPSAVQFKIKSENFRLAAGESHAIGWLRFNEDREVQVEFKKFQ